MSKDQKSNIVSLLILAPILALAFTLLSGVKLADSGIHIHANGGYVAFIVLTLFLAGCFTQLNHLIYRRQPARS